MSDWGLTTVRGRRLAVEDVGAGPTVLFLHGLGGTANVFQLQADALRAEHRVVRIDFAGAGRSPVADDVSIFAQAADAVAVLDLLGVASATVVGHSMGTVVARLVAASHPERVDALALLSPVRAPAPVEVRRRHRERAARLRAGGTSAIVDDVVRDSVSHGTRQSRPVVAALVRELVMRQDPEGYARSCEAAADARDPGPLPTSVAVLLAAGVDDRLGSLNVASALTSGTAARVVPIPGAGHTIPLEAEAQVADLIATLVEW